MGPGGLGGSSQIISISGHVDFEAPVGPAVDSGIHSSGTGGEPGAPWMLSVGSKYAVGGNEWV